MTLHQFLKEIWTLLQKYLASKMIHTSVQ